jgi:regulatory protein
MSKEITSVIPGIIGKKLQLYCAYQERCIKDVISKLKDWNLRENEIENIILDLKKNKFLDEKRFVRAYARGKFRMNKWGKQRIAFELHLKNISPQLIQQGLNEIEDKEYLEGLRQVIMKKKNELSPASEIKSGKNLNIREKIINFAHTKGFEMYLILTILDEFNF